MTDDVRHSQTDTDISSDRPALVTLDVVSTRFIAAGLPRSMRTLQRYCANGTLESFKEATETGDTYFVVEQSIDPAITALKQLHEAKGIPRQAATERAVTVSVGQEPASQIVGDMDRLGPTASDNDAPEPLPRQPASGPDTSHYVAQLEARLEEKDEEIEFLREELIDRRGQIRDMKGIIDGQNQLLETIQTNVAPIFNALAATVKSSGISLGRGQEANSDEFRQQPRPNDHDPSGFDGLHGGQA